MAGHSRINLAKQEDEHRRAVGRRIAELRERAGFPTQTALAKEMYRLLDPAGGGRSFMLPRVISELESGKGRRYRIGLAEVEAFAAALAVPPIALLDSLIAKDGSEASYMAELEARAERLRSEVLEGLDAPETGRLLNAFVKLAPDLRKAFVSAIEQLGTSLRPDLEDEAQRLLLDRMQQSFKSSGVEERHPSLEALKHLPEPPPKEES